MPEHVRVITVKRHAVVQPEDPAIKLIPLTQGKNAIVDADMYDHLRQWNWIASRLGKTDKFSAHRARVGGGKLVLMHREIMKAPDERYVWVDHINGNSLDNRRGNLRIATPAENSWNTKLRVTSRSGFKGVLWSKGRKKWIASIQCNGFQVELGGFDTAEKAAAVYDSAAIRLHGRFAKPNGVEISRKSVIKSLANEKLFVLLPDDPAARAALIAYCRKAREIGVSEEHLKYFESLIPYFSLDA